MKKFLLGMMVLGVALALAACGTVGNQFDASRAKEIKTGVSTKKDIEMLFGQPFKKGWQNGQPIWVYEYNKYRAVGSDDSTDLVVVFDDKGVVKSHHIMSSKPIP